MKTFVLVGIIGATLAAGADFRWEGRVGSGQLVQVLGVNGSIHAEASPDGIARVVAVKSATTSDPAAVTIQAVPYDGGVAVCVLYPDQGAEHPNTCDPANHQLYVGANNNDVQVDFTIQIPAGVRLTAGTVDGGIEATGLSGDVDARTVNGNITISTTGAGQANTVSGSISAVIGAVDWSGTHAFSTIHGSVDLQIPSDANVTIQAFAFGGAIVTDFALKSSATRFGNSSILMGTLGSGGRLLVIHSFSGNITLSQGPPAGK